jgi:hypothetical protein
MYDEMTNLDLICTLTETARPLDEECPQHAELMLEAAKRIARLEGQAKKWEQLADEWESAADAASNCGTPDNLRAFLNSL